MLMLLMRRFAFHCFRRFITFSSFSYAIRYYYFRHDADIYHCHFSFIDMLISLICFDVSLSLFLYAAIIFFFFAITLFFVFRRFDFLYFCFSC